MIAKRNEIIEYLDDYLKVKDFQDYCHDGLQVEGKENISKVVTGVTLSMRLIREAIKKEAGMLIVHHGIFVRDVPSPLQLKGLQKERVKEILCHDLNLAGYHLPLDAHPRIGNNASLSKMFGLKSLEKADVGFVGKLEMAISLDDFVRLVDKKLNVKSSVLKFGNNKIKRVGIISGGSSPDLEVIFREGADVFLCGDMREEVVRKAEEIGINIINAGHYNTEKLGIQNLGKIVEKNFKVKVEFVDIPCEI